MCRVRDDELLYILRHLATLRIGPNTIPPTNGVSFGSSTRGHLFHFYSVLLDLAFLRAPLPSMWMFPSEHATLFGLTIETQVPDTGAERAAQEGSSTEANGGPELDAGDGDELIEVGARDMAKRCLELIGEEMGIRG